MKIHNTKFLSQNFNWPTCKLMIYVWYHMDFNINIGKILHIFVAKNNGCSWPNLYSKTFQPKDLWSKNLYTTLKNAESLLHYKRLISLTIYVLIANQAPALPGKNLMRLRHPSGHFTLHKVFSRDPFGFWSLGYPRVQGLS